MAQPGPQQRFPSHITRISFPSIGGMVYFRVQQRWSGDVPPIAAVAKVEGLPWDSFNIFNLVNGVSDPDGTPTEGVSIANPVTDKMLSKYLYWAHRTEKNSASTTTGTSTPFYVVDTANWLLVYNGHVAFRQSTLLSKEAALAQFQGLIGSTGYEGLDPNLMAVGLYDNVGNPIISNPPDANFWAGVAVNGWTFHTEELPAGTSYRRTDTATLIINLGKLFRDMPKGSNGKKPAFIDFTIAPPDVPDYPSGHGGTALWALQAAAFKNKLTPAKDGGPKPGERRDFPVHDVSVPTGGPPQIEFDVPTFPFPDAAADVEAEHWPTGEKAHVKITFGVGDVAPKVAITFEGDEPEVG